MFQSTEYSVTVVRRDYRSRHMLARPVVVDMQNKDNKGRVCMSNAIGFAPTSRSGRLALCLSPRPDLENIPRPEEGHKAEEAEHYVDDPEHQLEPRGGCFFRFLQRSRQVDKRRKRDKK